VVHDLFFVQVHLPEKAIRSLAVYLFLVAVLRLAGKREFAQLNNFDLVVLLLLSNTVQNAIIGADDSLVGGLFGAAVLLAANLLIVRLTYRFPKLARVLEGRPTTLARHGRLLERNLRRERITREELMAAMRRQGVGRLADADLVVLESSGALTVEQHDQLGEVLERVRRIEARLAATPAAGDGGAGPVTPRP
jgi:uncharacterized membrane protein YcaP (DUF421 family)